jgi:excisionase family DNA binding protein
VPEITRLDDLPDLMRVEQAAAYLGISRGLVYELVKKGESQAVKYGRLVRIRRDGLRKQETR